jgi:hypothetical protein
MALGATVKTALIRISNSLVAFADEQGWKPDEYRILFHVSQKWGRIRVFFVVKDFGAKSSQEMWVQVFDHLERAFKTGPDIGFSIGLSVRDFDQLKKGPAYSVPPGYVDHKELLLAPSVTD